MKKLKTEVLFLGYCPYTKKAFDLLDSKNITYRTKEVNNENKKSFVKKNFFPTFPQIFINGNLIGGYSELVELSDKGFFENFDENLIINKVELGKITKSMEHFLFAQNYFQSEDFLNAKKELQAALKYYENESAKTLLKKIDKNIAKKKLSS
jgi:glutaredoxin